ncbi:MAG: hypothetical protein LBT81_01785 [Helicobacteraceae bacterium]|jgi:hypothetical protein|nr:hypothetical protein [Helicobacteraceae bacterium]
MRIRRYVFLSILLLIGLGIYIFINDDSDYTVKFGEDSFTLPLALWAIVPAIVMFAVSFSHIAFYSASMYLKRSALDKELKNLKKMIINALLGQRSDTFLKNQYLSAPTQLLANSRLVPLNDGIATGDEDIDMLLEMMEQVNGGTAVDLVSLKVPHNSPLWVRNQLNKMKNEPKVSEEILRETKEGSETYIKALEVFATYGDKRHFLKPNAVLSTGAVFNLLSRLNAKENALSFETDEMVSLAKKACFVASHYINLVRVLIRQVEPDMLLELFYHIKTADDQASSAWMYLNFELERIKEVQDTLDGSADDEYLPFKSYIALKNAGLSPALDALINCAY